MRKISMRKIREILRQKYGLGLTNRTIAVSVGISNSTVSDCIRRAKRAGLKWPLSAELDDERLEKLLYLPARNCTPEPHNIDWSYIHQEMRRKGVTRELLWHEYKGGQPDGINYSRFCELYRIWQQQIDCCMRQTYKAGEKMLVDYAGLTVPVVANIDTGEMLAAQIFVGVLGASDYIFTEATESQALSDWIGSHCRAFAYYGGVAEILIPDNLKTGINKAHRYEPDLNPTYADMAEHYNIAIVQRQETKLKLNKQCNMWSVKYWPSCVIECFLMLGN
jgi:transposase